MVIKDPGNPTQAEIDMHEIDHLPFRSWCRWCVLGRGRGLQHRARTEPVIPVIGLDYFFLTGTGVVLQKEMKMDDMQLAEARTKGDVTKCLVVRCFASFCRVE